MPRPRKAPLVLPGGWDLVRKRAYHPESVITGPLLRERSSGQYAMLTDGQLYTVPEDWAAVQDRTARAARASADKLGPEGRRERAQRAALARISGEGGSMTRTVAAMTPEEWSELDALVVTVESWEPIWAAMRRMKLSLQSRRVVTAVLYSRHGLPMPRGGVRY